jgi:hypothetical protein
MIPPLPFVWTGEGLKPLSSRAADQHYVIGERYTVAPIEERSEVSHRHEFAWLREAHASLPDHLAAEYPTPDHLRKRALIATGFCTTADYVCGNRAEALRWAANMRKEVDEYTLVIVSNTVVRVHKAKSQKRGAMDKAEFQASKTAIIEWVAGLLDVAPDTLARAA